MVLVDEWHIRLLVGPEESETLIKELTNACDAAVRQAASDLNRRLAMSRSDLDVQVTVER
jgi:hypothetical protein